MAEPNFLVIGAQRAGTTWLSEMLRQHPDVFAPETKELHFFDHPSNRRRAIEEYRERFDGHRGERAIGEFTPNYLWVVADERDEHRPFEDIPERIAKHFADLKLVVSLRDPVERAISAFLHHVRMRRFGPGTDVRKVFFQYGIASMGLYASCLRRWFEFFPREAFRFVFFETDIRETPAETLAGLYEFLGVDASFSPARQERPVNRRAGSTSVWLKHLFPRRAPQMLQRFPALARWDFPPVRVSRAARRELTHYFEEPNRQLGALLDREVPWPNNGE